MRVLIACETSGIVRRAFLAAGHDAWSIDTLPSEDASNRHMVGDVRGVLDWGWDLMAVMHPPCTRLCNSGVRWLSGDPPPGRTRVQMWDELDAAAELFSDCWNAPIPRIAVENPKMHHHAKERIRGYQRPAQIAQPWWFGEPTFKGIGLYLKNLPPLTPTDKLTPPKPGTPEHKAWSWVHRASPGGKGQEPRWKKRSRFFPTVAQAMADQWGGTVLEEALAA